MKDYFSLLLPLWVLIASTLACFFSPEVAQFKNALMPLIAFIMFAMGLTITAQDVLVSLRQPQALLIGVLLQFLLMPALAWLISTLLGLPEEIFIGMILAGAAPGGVSSNVLTYLAGGRVALSVSMTTVSTLVSIIMTPWITALYLQEVVDVDQSAMLISIAQMIVVPVLAGIIFKAALPKLATKALPVLPGIAVLGIAAAIGLVVALNANALTSLGIMTVSAVALHNLSGLVAGYTLARLMGQDTITARTIAIEVGAQNCGMASALAVKHFSALAAIPPTLLSIIQVITGTGLASYWSNRLTREPATENRLTNDS
ncbi:bile acid:sodium symporter family protein [Endozoicomonas sp.]|uniref:bile acid:sodium symporter family protein n=1 Tax=Endozoicomonas sp. TaxID=1892382 RepID=UPI00288456DD|nr:bile acid:sodium symporter family protein [Endozoicomonas sp.]